MKISNEFKVVVAFFCVCLIYHIDGLPQSVRHGPPRHHHNSTAWNNSGRHNATHHRPNHMIGHQNHTNHNNWHSHHRPNQTMDHQNQTNTNNWHPHHRPGRPWQNNHHSFRRNLTQVNNGSYSYPTWYAGLALPYTVVAETHTENSFPLSNSIGNQGIGSNSGSQLAPLAGLALPYTVVAETHTENSFPLSNSTGNQGIGSNSGPQLAPLAGSASGHQNTVGWNLPSGQLNGTYSAHPYGKLFA